MLDDIDAASPNLIKAPTAVDSNSENTVVRLISLPFKIFIVDSVKSPNSPSTAINFLSPSTTALFPLSNFSTASTSSSNPTIVLSDTSFLPYMISIVSWIVLISL